MYVVEILGPGSYIEDYSFPSNEENNLRENNIVDTQTVFIKVTEICPISYDKDVISYQVNCHGGVFYNQDYNFAIVIPQELFHEETVWRYRQPQIGLVLT